MRRELLSRSIRIAVVISLVFACMDARPLLGQDEVPAGQADLDKATSAKLSASSMADLEEVIELCESAMEKGLDDESETLAKSLLTATLFQHGSRFASALFDQRERAERPAMLKQFALRDLEKVLEYDDSIAGVHMMIARLHAVNIGRGIRPEGFQKGQASAERAIELLADDKPMLSRAYVLRAGYVKSGSERMEYLTKAIETDPKNADAWRLRGKNRLVEGELLSAAGQVEKAKEVREKAIEDFSKLLEENPDDPDALQAVAELLGRIGNYDEAIAKANQAIEKNPRAASLFILRGRLHHKTGKLDEAIEDFDQAVDIQPDSYIAFLDRSEVNYEKGDKEAAGEDFSKAREIHGVALTQTVLQRVTVRSEGEFEKAIQDLKRFVELDEASADEAGRNPDPDYGLQLGQSYLVTKQESLAVDALTKVIDNVGEKPTDRRMRNARLLGLRTRADAYLGLGEHPNAVSDYDEALKLNRNEDGVLNNLAWVLATSPMDEVRDGDRAIDLATKACKVTDYKQAHILSTLAAAYAESGDFDKAMEWSTKAVEMGSATTAPETQQQLKNELENYKQKKPWRELQGQEDSAQDEPAEEETDTEEAEETVESN